MNCEDQDLIAWRTVWSVFTTTWTQMQTIWASTLENPERNLEHRVQLYPNENKMHIPNTRFLHNFFYFSTKQQYSIATWVLILKRTHQKSLSIRGLGEGMDMNGYHKIHHRTRHRTFDVNTQKVDNYESGFDEKDRALTFVTFWCQHPGYIWEMELKNI